jgi:hypothetical protein
MFRADTSQLWGGGPAGVQNAWGGDQVEAPAAVDVNTMARYAQGGGMRWKLPKLNDFDQSVNLAIHQLACAFFTGQELDTATQLMRLGSGKPVPTVEVPVTDTSSIQAFKFDMDFLKAFHARTGGLDDNMIKSLSSLIVFCLYAQSVRDFLRTLQQHDVVMNMREAGRGDLTGLRKLIPDLYNLDVEKIDWFTMSRQLVALTQGIWTWQADTIDNPIVASYKRLIDAARVANGGVADARLDVSEMTEMRNGYQAFRLQGAVRLRLVAPDAVKAADLNNFIAIDQPMQGVPPAQAAPGTVLDVECQPSPRSPGIDALYNAMNDPAVRNDVATGYKSLLFNEYAPEHNLLQRLASAVYKAIMHHGGSSASTVTLGDALVRRFYIVAQRYSDLKRMGAPGGRGPMVMGPDFLQSGNTGPNNAGITCPPGTVPKLVVSDERLLRQGDQKLHDDLTAALPGGRALQAGDPVGIKAAQVEGMPGMLKPGIGAAGCLPARSLNQIVGGAQLFPQPPAANVPLFFGATPPNAGGAPFRADMTYFSDMHASSPLIQQYFQHFNAPPAFQAMVITPPPQ